MKTLIPLHQVPKVGEFVPVLGLFRMRFQYILTETDWTWDFLVLLPMAVITHISTTLHQDNTIEDTH